MVDIPKDTWDPAACANNSLALGSHRSQNGTKPAGDHHDDGAVEMPSDPPEPL